MNSIVKLLREIRIEKKISQASLAVRAGFSINQIWNWENGQTCPTLDNAIAWAEALGYEFDLHLKEPANV